MTNLGGGPTVPYVCKCYEPGGSDVYCTRCGGPADPLDVPKTIRELVNEIVDAVDDRDLTFDEKVLEIATRLLERVKELDDRVWDAVDSLTEVGVDLTTQKES